MIEGRGIGYQYNGEPVIRDLSWSIDRGEKWGLIGPSGAGKTTLMRLMTGYLHPNDGGEVLIQGESSPNLARWRRQVGWMSSDLIDKIPSGQSLIDTVVAGKHSQTLKAERSDLEYDDADFDEAKKLLERLGIGSRIGQSLGELSQGERQLALIARAFVNKPRFVVLDEPCAGLDPGAREVFLAELEDFLEEKPDTSAVYVTHHVEEILPLFEQVLAISTDGQTMRGGRSELLSPDVMETVYGTKFNLEFRDERYWPVGLI